MINIIVPALGYLVFLLAAASTANPTETLLGFILWMLIRADWRAK